MRVLACVRGEGCLTRTEPPRRVPAARDSFPKWLRITLESHQLLGWSGSPWLGSTHWQHKPVEGGSPVGSAQPCTDTRLSQDDEERPARRGLRAALSSDTAHHL